MRAPLEGVRVIEVASFVAVPAAGTLLADLGADVVKVEVPAGELYRHVRPRFFGHQSDFPENPPFHMDNRGKRSIGLDLTRPEAQEAVRRMADRAEIFLTNLLPARRRKYGLDHETLIARNPRLLVGAINGYGSGGEEADRPAFDYAAYWARTGMMDLMRDAGVAPSLQRPGVGDHAAAVNLVCGLLAAMRLRDADGRGRYVETSLFQTGLHVLGTDLSNALVTGESPPRHDRTRPPNPLWNSYPTAGGRWVLLVMVEPDRYWPRLCAALEREDLRGDARFATAGGRATHAAALVAELERTFQQRSLEEWRARLDTAGLIWSPVQHVDEAARDPQARAMGYFQEVEHPTAGRFETVGPPFRIEGTALGAHAAASPLHADARAVLREAGLDETEIDRLL